MLIFLGEKLVGANFYVFCNYDVSGSSNMKRLGYIEKIGSPSNMDDQLLHVLHVDGGHLNKAAAASSSCVTTAFAPGSHRQDREAA